MGLQGYGITLGTINALSVLTSALQAIPNLQIQVPTRRPAAPRSQSGSIFPAASDMQQCALSSIAVAVERTYVSQILPQQ